MDARSPETARETYGVDQYPGTVLFAKKEWIDANGAQARRLADAIRKAYAWVRSHSTAEVAARLAGQREDVIASTTAMLTPDGRFTAEGVEAARKLAASPADAATSYTNEFIARERIRIAIGGQTQLVYLPTTLAQQLGYYADEGIEVELQDFAGGSKALEALFGGSADVVSGFYDHIAQMAGQGKQLKPFVSMLRYPGLALIAAPGKHVASVRELKGKIVGVSSAGSSTHNLLNHLLKKEGLSPDSVSVVGVGMAAGSVAAMESGTVDAAVMAEPAITQLKARKGELHVLADTRTQMGVRAVYGVDTYPAAVLYSKKEWVESNPETARKLTRAIVRTLAWIQTHSGEQIAAKMPDWLQGQGEVIERSKAMYSIDGALP
jgi:NitT/TauT family transport system substrate-binding protein